MRIIEGLVNHRPLQRVYKLTDSLSLVLGNCTSSAICPELIDFMGWLQTAPSEHTRLLKATLARLLPRVGEDELELSLTEERRETLRRLLKRSDTPPELTTAILLALSSVRDTKAVPLAYELLRKRPDVRDAVEAFLDVMRIPSVSPN